MVLIQCHGKSRAILRRYIISIHDYLLFVGVVGWCDGAG